MFTSYTYMTVSLLQTGKGNRFNSNPAEKAVVVKISDVTAGV